jgi:uncharacterized protein YbjQ (UPF0145 family)
MDFYSISLSNVTPVKLVTAKANYGIGFLTAFVGIFCSLFGIPNDMFTQKLKKAETLAMEELIVNAKAVGADGVMDVRCQIDGLSFLVCGTAYKWSPAERAKREAEGKAKREAEEQSKREIEENIDNFVPNPSKTVIPNKYKDSYSCPKCGCTLKFGQKECLCSWQMDWSKYN